MPWEQTTWWLIGAAALAFTTLSILRLRENIVALFIADAVAILLWVLWGIQAFAIEQVTQTGTTVTHNYPELGYLALVFAVVMMLDLFLTVMEAMVSEFTGDTNG